MDCDSVLSAVKSYLTSNTSLMQSKRGCRIALPLTEPNGDVISVSIEQADEHWLVHDGGHMAGLLFEAGPVGARSSDLTLLKQILQEGGANYDTDTGRVSIQTDFEGLGRCALVLAQLIMEVDIRLPTHPVPRRRQRQLGPRLAQEVFRRLASEDILKAVQAGASVKGISQTSRHVDVRYLVPQTTQTSEKEVLILALDLDVKDPVHKAFRGIEVAHDLAGVEDHRVVRLLWSRGEGSVDADPAEKLIRFATKNESLFGFSWDVLDQRLDFMAILHQELAL